MSQATALLTKIQNAISEQILNGTLACQQKLPSERELSEHFSTTRITIKNALASLETRGLIYREERRGWFVSPARVIYNPLSRCHFNQMIQDQHRSADTKLINIKSITASNEYTSTLELDEFSTIHIIERLRYIDGRAVLFVENCLIDQFFPDILEEDLTSSLTALYKQKYDYTTSRSRFTVIPTAAPDHVAKALNLAQGQQVLKICRVNYNQNGVIIDCEFEYWRPDVIEITIDSD